MTKPRFTLVINKGQFVEVEHKFFTLAGLNQWLANAKETGQVKKKDIASIYDDSGVKL